MFAFEQGIDVVRQHHSIDRARQRGDDQGDLPRVGSVVLQGLVERLLIRPGHPFLSHREGTAALEFLGSLFRSELARNHVVGLGTGCAGTQEDARRQEESQSAAVHGVMVEQAWVSLESPQGRRVKPMTAIGMKIGALASRSGLPIKTLRYYEDLGLLPAVGRSEGGYRLFGEESLRRLEFIRRLKSLGLTLDEIQECLAVHDAGELPCGDIQRQLQRQIDLVDERLRELRLFRKELESLLQNWQSDPAPNTAVICPNLNV